MASIEVADILRVAGPAFRASRAGNLSLAELKVMSAIEACRTAALGGHVEGCDDCGHLRVAYNSCRNRHCPRCQGAAAGDWLTEREADLLPVGYFHVVFTLPTEIAAIAFQNKAAIYDLLFRASTQTMTTIAADPKHLGARIGLTAVLHTWGSAMTHHPHIHMIVPGGGLAPDGTRWIASRSAFLLLATTMRWGMNGAIVGAVVLEAVLILVGLPDLEDGDSELNVLIMRSAYFIVAAAMLGYFGASRDRSRQRLARLADWPSDSVTSDRTVWLNSIIHHAAEVLGDPRLIIVWDDQDEPKGSVGYWADGNLRLVDIEDKHFWSAQNLERPPSADHFGDQPSEIEQAKLLLASVPGLRAERAFPIRRSYSATFSGLRYRGCLFVLDPACHPEESVLLTDIIAARIGAELERLALLQQVSMTARSQERVRLARDLHDSILQDLTAAGLKLKAITARVPDEAKSDLAVVSELMLDQQRRIRMFVEGVNLFERFDKTSLSAVLEHCTASLCRQWNCAINPSVNPPEATISTSMSREVVQLISEATANAVRHGGATSIDIEAVRGSRELLLRIADNGRGIVDGEPGQQKEPISLNARVTDLGGILSVIHDAPGLEIHVRLPISEDAIA